MTDYARNHAELPQARDALAGDLGPRQDLLRDLTAPVWLRGIRGDQRPGAYGSPPRAAPVSILRNTRATTPLNSGATARQRHFRGCRNAALVSGTDDPDALVITGHGVTGATVTRQARPTRLAAGLRADWL